MNREQSLNEFNNNISIFINESEREFKENLIKNKEKVKELIINALKEVIEEAKTNQEINSEYKLAYLYFEFLRTSILDESYKILLHGYNSSLYLDRNDVIKYIDLKFLFSPFIALKVQLMKERKIYIGKINEYDIDKIIFNLALKCYKSMVNSVRNWCWNLDEQDFINQSSVDESYFIQWGEYQGTCEIVFAMDNREKTTKQLVELKKSSKEKYPFVYTVWKDSNLENCELAGINMMLINFKGSSLKKIDFSGNNITRGQYKDTKINECNFNNSILSGAEFENSKIQDCTFENTNLTLADFKKSQLQYVSFENADLTNANFIDADIYKVSFKNAKLNKAIFSRDDVPFLHLSPEQLQGIYIDGGK